VDELNLIITRTRAHGPQSLPLDGWDHASVWGWDETAESLYAHLWSNADDPAKPPAIRIGSGDYTPAITLLPTLAQHIAMATDNNAWDVLMALEEIVDQDEDWSGEGKVVGGDQGGTVVTMTEGLDIWWPSNSASK